MGNHKKILLLLDGSDLALDAARYISVESFTPKLVVLLSIMPSVPESYHDMESDPESREEIEKIKQWQEYHQKKREQYMENARLLLKDGGIENVEVKIRPKVRGIARDIILEASKGYDAVVFSRRGMGQLAGIPVGSVATKLLNHLSFVPLIVVSDNICSNRLLIGVDGSEDAIGAVAFMDKMLGGHHEVELINVIRNANMENLDSYMMMTDAGSRHAREKTKVIIEEMKDRLAEIGFERDKIGDKIVTGAVSRAGAILDEAAAGGFDTIVLGRRGLSRINEFYMGRVSNKVVLAGGAFTVWLI